MATEDPIEPQLNNPTPPKFSRYRSVRDAAQQAPPPSPPSVPQTTSQNASIARSMSRYRRAKPPSQNLMSPLPPVPPTHQPSPKQPISPPINILNSSPLVQIESLRTQSSDSIPKQRRGLALPQPITNSSGSASRLRTTPSQRRNEGTYRGSPQDCRERNPLRKQRDGQTSMDCARREARDILGREAERMRKLKAQQDAIKEAEKERRKQRAATEARQKELEENESRERQRIELAAVEIAKREKVLEEEHIANKKEAARIAALEAKKAARLDGKERFGFLSRDNGGRNGPILKTASKSNDSLKRIISPPQAIETPEFSAPQTRRGTPPMSEPSYLTHVPKSTDRPRTSDSGKAIDPPNFIETGGVVVPGIDAPISAVNAEGRKVLVKCKESSITLPITPTTTPADLIYSAANCLSESIDLKASILVESFIQLGLERPLRKYEHIRDVMNSWDNDAQNTLMIIPSPENGSEDDLDVKNAPREQPGDTSVFLYHSMKPGHWDKRWVTLRSDGQVLVAKKADGEKINICHLSDFDIYAPKPRQLAKRIKPPKKICFAVKSQQKSSIFLSGANFVHFFSTSDKKLAAEWYKAVQGWRSWYLVNVMGEGQKKPKKANGAPQLEQNAFLSSSQPLPYSGHQRSVSADSTPYQLGSFSPLLDLDQFGHPKPSLPQRSNSVTRTNHGRNPSTRERKLPPSSFPSKLLKDLPAHGRGPSVAQGPTSQEIEQATFAPDGLLGRTYSQHQKAQQLVDPNTAGPFLTGLLNGDHEPSPSAVLGRTNSTRSSHGPSTALGRSPSQRQKPKPLVDLTPVYQEPPQHARKGRGVTAEPGKQLVEIATGPEVLPGAIIVPPLTTWQRPQTQGGGALQDSGLHRTGSRRAPTVGRRLSMDMTRPSLDDNSAFTGTGLLALRGMDSRPIGTGRGVATGDRNAKAPMLNVTHQSHFQEGSLLRSVEMHTGADGPVIDREKRVEGEVKVGEGL